MTRITPIVPKCTVPRWVKGGLRGGGKLAVLQPVRTPAGAMQRGQDASRMPPVAPADVLHPHREQALGDAREHTFGEALWMELGVHDLGDRVFLTGGERPPKWRERSEHLGH